MHPRGNCTLSAIYVLSCSTFQVFAIGVGQYEVNLDELTDIASDGPELFVMMARYAETLLPTYGIAAKRVCQGSLTSHDQEIDK